MTYNEILPLTEVKNYLRLEDDFAEDDTALERMVRSALQFIEKRTNHIFALRENVTYSNECGKITVFDYPVRFTNPDDVFIQYKSDRHVVYSKSIIAEVGYLNADDVPSALIDAALQMIKCFYFEAEKQSNTTLLPENVLQIINTYRRFTVC